MNRVAVFCPKCGAEIEHGEKVCSVCGFIPVKKKRAAAAEDDFVPEIPPANGIYTNPMYPTHTYPSDDIGLLTRKIDAIHSQQQEMMQDTESLLKKYAKKRSACIAVLGILVGILSVVCILLAAALILVTSDMAVQIMELVGQINEILSGCNEQINYFIELFNDVIVKIQELNIGSF